MYNTLMIIMVICRQYFTTRVPKDLLRCWTSRLIPSNPSPILFLSVLAAISSFSSISNTRIHSCWLVFLFFSHYVYTRPFQSYFPHLALEHLSSLLMYLHVYFDAPHFAAVPLPCSFPSIASLELKLFSLPELIAKNPNGNIFLKNSSGH